VFNKMKILKAIKDFLKALINEIAEIQATDLFIRQHKGGEK